MPSPSAQVIEQARSTRQLLEVTTEENKQCFADAYISDIAKVKDVLKDKFGLDPFRIQVCYQTTAQPPGVVHYYYAIFLTRDSFSTT